MAVLLVYFAHHRSTTTRSPIRLHLNPHLTSCTGTGTQLPNKLILLCFAFRKTTPGKMKPSLAPVASAWKLATSAPPQPATQSSAPPTTTADQNRVPEKQKRNLDTNNWPSLPSQAQCQPEASFRKPQKHLRWTDMSFDAPTPELSGIETSSSYVYRRGLHTP